MIVLMIELRIAEPDLDRGLAPADAPFADRYLVGKGAGLEPLVQGGSAEAGAVEPVFSLRMRSGSSVMMPHSVAAGVGRVDQGVSPADGQDGGT